jgi:putative FmdB family regulatory protein
MPTYEYVCKDCGEHLEVVQSFKDDALTTCPACGGPLRKVFHSIGISFKGSGFYRTDSRPAAKAESDAKPKAAEGSGEKSASGGDGTKSADAAKPADTPKSSDKGKGGGTSKGGDTAKGGDTSKGGDKAKSAAATG